MKIEYENAEHKVGGAMPLFDRKYDYLLFRQDWKGVERVYFKKTEIANVV